MVVLKIGYHGEFRRVVLKESEPTYEGIQAVIAKAWPELANVQVKYRDDEGDLCSLCEATFQDFLFISCKPAAPFRLELVDAPRVPCPGSGRAKDGFNRPWWKALHMEEHLNGPWRKAYRSAVRKHLHERPRCRESRYAGADVQWHWRPRKVLWILARLRATNALDGAMFASLVVHHLPKMLKFFASHERHVDEWASERRAKIHPMVEALFGVAQETAGLEECLGKVEGWLRDSPAVRASETLLSVLKALHALPFGQKIAVVERLYSAQELHLTDLLDWIDEETPRLAKGTLEHARHACDGCNAGPLRGPRFRCTVCPDVDFCGQCYSRKHELHDETHEFECLVFDPTSWKRHHCPATASGGFVATWQCRQGKRTDVELAGCRRRCGYARTWHKTHCCFACANGGFHGPRCERRLWPEEVPDAKRSKPTSRANNACDMIFPVVVEDGRQLEIRWNRGDDLDQVAQQFAEQHSIPADEFWKIAEFLKVASETCQGQRTDAHDSEQKAPSDEQEQTVAKLTDGDDVEKCVNLQAQTLVNMGFQGSPQELRELLRAAGGDLQRAIDLIT